MNFGGGDSPEMLDPGLLSGADSWETAAGNPEAPQPFFREPTPITAPVPDKAFQEAAFDYITKWCFASREYVLRKAPRWQWLRDLYKNLHTVETFLDENYTGNQPVGNSRLEARTADDTEKAPWQENRIYGPAHVINRFQEEAHPAIFDGDWLTVTATDQSPGQPPPPPEPPPLPPGLPPELVQLLQPQPPQTPPEQDFQTVLPLGRRLAWMMLRDLDRARLKDGQRTCLHNLALLGTVYLKTSWYEHTGMQWVTDGKKTWPEPVVYWDCPLVEEIQLEDILPDKEARHRDIQRWSGIGHIVSRTYEEVKDGFRNGRYHLNETDFDDLFENAKTGTSRPTSDYSRDSDAETITDERSFLRVWEWHGKVPHEKWGLTEVVAAFAVDRDSDDPSTGVLIKLVYGAALPDGRRPFDTEQYVPQAGPFGLGMIDVAEEIIWQISRLQNMLIDNLNVTAVPSWVEEAFAGIKAQIKEDGGFYRPGRIYTAKSGSNPATALVPFPTGTFNIQWVFQAITYWIQQFELKTLAYQIGGGSREGNTATEAQIQQNQSQRPILVRTRWYSENALEPALEKCLSLVQQNRLQDQTITVRNGSGMEVPATVTAKEIQNGTFKIRVAITKNDTRSISKAQSIERGMQMIQNLDPLLQRENSQAVYAELIRRYLDLIEVEGSTDIIRTLGSVEQGLMQQIQQLQQQIEQMQKAGPAKGPSESISFKDLPPDGQIQMAAQAGIKLDPQILMLQRLQQVMPAQPSPGGIPDEGLGPPGPSQGPPPGMPPGMIPPDVGADGGPMGPMQNDTNMQLAQTQMDAQANQGGMPLVD